MGILNNVATARMSMLRGQTAKLASYRLLRQNLVRFDMYIGRETDGHGDTEISMEGWREAKLPHLKQHGPNAYQNLPKPTPLSSNRSSIVMHDPEQLVAYKTFSFLNNAKIR